jgi:hypothetical protein
VFRLGRVQWAKKSDQIWAQDPAWKLEHGCRPIGRTDWRESKIVSPLSLAHCSSFHALPQRLKKAKHQRERERERERESERAKAKK